MTALLCSGCRAGIVLDGTCQGCGLPYSIYAPRSDGPLVDLASASDAREAELLAEIDDAWREHERRGTFVFGFAMGLLVGVGLVVLACSVLS